MVQIQTNTFETGFSGVNLDLHWFNGYQNLPCTTKYNGPDSPESCTVCNHLHLWKGDCKVGAKQ